MYKSVIRDPSGNGLIRIIPDVSGFNNAIVNGSILVVPPGTSAFVAINGILSKRYNPGQYEIFTGVDPFFVSLRNIMTQGDTGTTVSVYFISTNKSKFLQLGTGEFPFAEHRFRLTMKAKAACTLTFNIGDPLLILERLVGSYTSIFNEESLDASIQQIMLKPIREVLTNELSKHRIDQFNGRLSVMSNEVMSNSKKRLADFGINLTHFSLTSINISDGEMARLNNLEQSYAEAKTKTDLELDHLDRIWKGNLDSRTLAELMTGLPARGGFSSDQNSPCSARTSEMTPILQMMMLSQILPFIREPIASMTQHTDLFGGERNRPHENSSTADSPPPMPSRFKQCPICKGSIPKNTTICQICGHVLSE